MTLGDPEMVQCLGKAHGAMWTGYSDVDWMWSNGVWTSRFHSVTGYFFLGGGGGSHLLEPPIQGGIFLVTTGHDRWRQCLELRNFMKTLF